MNSPRLFRLERSLILQSGELSIQLLLPQMPICCRFNDEINNIQYSRIEWSRPTQSACDLVQKGEGEAYESIYGRTTGIDYQFRLTRFEPRLNRASVVHSVGRPIPRRGGSEAHQNRKEGERSCEHTSLSLAIEQDDGEKGDSVGED